MMEKDYLNIIKEKEFIELSSTERAELADICTSEEEFNATKAMLRNVDSIIVEPITPEPKTKASLDSLFAQSYPKAAPIWYNSVFAVIVPKEKPLYRQPLLQVAAAFLIFWMVFPFFNSELKTENKKLAKVEKQHDEELPVIKEPKAEIQQEMPVTRQTTNEQQPISNNETPVLNPSAAERRSFPGSSEATSFSAMIADEEVIALEKSTHPDGVFISSSDQSIAFGQSANETSDLLDLLTATF